MILYDDSSKWTCVHVSNDLQEPQFISITGNMIVKVDKISECNFDFCVCMHV